MTCRQRCGGPFVSDRVGTQLERQRKRRHARFGHFAAHHRQPDQPDGGRCPLSPHRIKPRQRDADDERVRYGQLYGHGPLYPQNLHRTCASNGGVKRHALSRIPHHHAQFHAHSAAVDPREFGRVFPGIPPDAHAQRRTDDRQRSARLHRVPIMREFAI